MTSDIRVGRGSKIAPKMGRYRVGQGMWVKNGQKKWDVINGRSLGRFFIQTLGCI